MKLGNRTTSGRIRTSIARVLSCALLIGIVYSATFNAVHSHGIALSKAAANISHNFTGQPGDLFEVPLRSRTDRQECLICVLHRQFSGSIVHTPFFIAELSTESALVFIPAIFHHSVTFLSGPIARHSGRAPPLCQA